MKILRYLCAALGLSMGGACLADDSINQVNSLFNIYQSICLKHLNNMDEARRKLQPIPALPPEKAASFLSGNVGTAWPVPDKYGLFVLVIHEKKNYCAVHVRRVNQALAEKRFSETFSKAPAPLASALVLDERKTSAANVPTHMLSYTWSTPSAKRKMLFALSTSTSADAPLQGILSAATTSD